MAQIDKPNTHFNTVLWNGDNADNRSITGVGFQPDFVWQKTRNQNYSHSVYDVIRGVTNRQVTNDTAADQTYLDFKSFDSDGFTIDEDALHLNQTGDTNVAWNWKAGGTAVSNTDGTITSSVSANTTSGFSVVTYTGNATTSQSVGHGLNSVPKMIIVKNRIDASDWKIYHASLGTSSQIILNSSAAASSAGTLWGSTTPTSNLFYINNDGSVNGSGDGMVAYCFAEKSAFSRMGSYTGNGSSDGTFVYTGFKPAFLIYKQSSASGESWIMHDNARNLFNVTNKRLLANADNAEADEPIDFLSNGFKCRTSGAFQNASGSTYIYLAIAESPLVGSNGVPTTAR